MGRNTRKCENLAIKGDVFSDEAFPQTIDIMRPPHLSQKLPWPKKLYIDLPNHIKPVSLYKGTSDSV